jgi:hypothetical protein
VIEMAVNVSYAITVPHKAESHYELHNNDVIGEVINLFKAHDIECNTVDTIAGSFSLNQEWIETKSVEAETEYNSVLPVCFSPLEKDMFLGFINRGHIVVRVHYVNKDKDGNVEYVPHH